MDKITKIIDLFMIMGRDLNAYSTQFERLDVENLSDRELRDIKIKQEVCIDFLQKYSEYQNELISILKDKNFN